MLCLGKLRRVRVYRNAGRRTSFQSVIPVSVPLVGSVRQMRRGRPPAQAPRKRKKAQASGISALGNFASSSPFISKPEPGLHSAAPFFLWSCQYPWKILCNFWSSLAQRTHFHGCTVLKKEQRWRGSVNKIRWTRVISASTPTRSLFKNF